MLLLVLGAALAVAGGLQSTYRTVFRDQAWTTTLWISTADPPRVPERDAYYTMGWPVTVAALLMVVAAVLVLRERTAFVGRPMAMAAAGALAATVFAYTLQLRREAKIMSEWPTENGLGAELVVLGGTYLLGAAAVVGVAGAVLAQGRPEERPQEDEEAVVVHQLDDDDDTPPFGIEIPGQEQQETR